MDQVLAATSGLTRLTAAWNPGLQGIVGISVTCSHLTLNVGSEMESPSSTCWGPGVWDVNPCWSLSPRSREALRAQSSDVSSVEMPAQARGPEASLSIHVGSFR